MRSSTRPLTGGLVPGSRSNSDSAHPARRAISPSTTVALATCREPDSDNTSPSGPAANRTTSAPSTGNGTRLQRPGTGDRPRRITQVIGEPRGKMSAPPRRAPRRRGRESATFFGRTGRRSSAVPNTPMSSRSRSASIVAPGSTTAIEHRRLRPLPPRPPPHGTSRGITHPAEVSSRPRLSGELVDVPVRRSEMLPGIAVGHDPQTAEQLDPRRAPELIARRLDVVHQETSDNRISRELPRPIGDLSASEHLQLRAVGQRQLDEVPAVPTNHPQAEHVSREGAHLGQTVSANPDPTDALDLHTPTLRPFGAPLLKREPRRADPRENTGRHVAGCRRLSATVNRSKRRRWRRRPTRSPRPALAEVEPRHRHMVRRSRSAPLGRVVRDRGQVGSPGRHLSRNRGPAHG